METPNTRGAPTGRGQEEQVVGVPGPPDTAGPGQGAQGGMFSRGQVAARRPLVTLNRGVRVTVRLWGKRVAVG